MTLTRGPRATTNNRSSAGKRPPTHFRPRLEGLEDRLAPAADVGDTLSRALNTHLGAAPGTYTTLNQHLGDGTSGALDVDMFKFQANAGQALTVTTSAADGGSGVDTWLRLFDAAGNQLDGNDDFNSSQYSQINEYVFSASGTYYVGVSGNPNYYYNPNQGGSGTGGSTGDYRLDINLVTPTSDAAGDALAMAQSTGLGPAGSFAVDARIGDGLYFRKDVDLYRLDNVAAGQLLNARTLIPAGSQLFAYIRLFDATGNPLAIADGSSYPNARLSYQFATGGTYFVGVSDYYNPVTVHGVAADTGMSEGARRPALAA